jgi:hypothetical protein
MTVATSVPSMTLHDQIEECWRQHTAARRKQDVPDLGILPLQSEAVVRTKPKHRRDNKKTAPKQKPTIFLGLSQLRQLRRGIVPKGLDWTMVNFREGEKALYEKASAAEAAMRINGVTSRAPKRRLKLNCAPALI